MIVIIDYGMGNLKSVYNALKVLGLECKISSSPHDIRAAKALILPGVELLRKLWITYVRTPWIK